ncbi:uncharacterized protein LOC143296407 [Babylonia areolata]|uniref:uncharacterized protein LOC143296407 n=1 Tax=Babylonia areolata TaxID=304850 RepID=UPI003FCFAF3E
MSLHQTDTVLDVSFHLVTENDNVTNSNTLSVQTDGQNTSYADGCQTVIFSEMEFIPWDNPDNIVSAEVETASKNTKDIALVLLFLIGGPGNVINMAVFIKQGFKDRVNVCLFALSLADELYLIIAMLHHADQVVLQFTTKERYSPLLNDLASHFVTGLIGLVYVSQILSAIIASERCYCVLKPLKSQSVMRNRTMVAIITIVYVIVVGLYCIVSIQYTIGCIHDPQSGVVVETIVASELYRKNKEWIDFIAGVVVGVVIPIPVIILVIITTVITIVKLRQIVTWRTETSSSISPREVALTKMLVGTSILFIVCSFPGLVVRTASIVSPEFGFGRRYHNFAITQIWINEVLTYVNASFNIFVYYAMGSRYRHTLASFIKKVKT